MDMSGSAIFTGKRYKGQEGAAADAPVHTHMAGLGVNGMLMQDLNANPLDYVEGGKYNERRVQLSEWLDSLNPDLSAFLKHGGKLIVLAGIVAIAAAAAWVLDYKLPVSPGVLAIAAGVLVLVVVVYNYSGLQDDTDQATQLGISASIGLGYLIDAVAGVLAIVGGVLGLQTLKR